MRLMRAKIYSPFIGLGIILVALGIVLGLAEDPLILGNHTYLMTIGMLSIFAGILLYQKMKRCLHKNTT